MRSRTVLVAFLLLLYIGPSIFIVSYASPTILTEPNMNKEFVISADWWNETYHYRKELLINGGDETNANYAVEIPVTYDSDMQTDFDDIRFTEDDHITVLDYWLESYVASTSAVFWVEVTDIILAGLGGGHTDLYMYYGNADVSTTSNGTNTFIFFDDFENNNFNRWTDSTSDAWSIQTGIVNQGTYAAYANYASGDRWLGYTFAEPLNYSFMYHVDIRLESVSSQYSYHGYAQESTAEDVYIGFTASNDWASFDSGVVYFEEDTVAVDTWYEQEVSVDFEDNELQCWVDDDPKDTLPLKDATDNTVADIALIRMGPVAAVGFDIWVDEYYIRQWIDDEPVFASFGSEENNFPPPEWELVNEAELIFFVPVDLWAWDMSLILIGLCMIPASTVYLVYGGKNNFSTNKLFYGLILFLMGVGLIIGGIM